MELPHQENDGASSPAIKWSSFTCRNKELPYLWNDGASSSFVVELTSIICRRRELPHLLEHGAPSPAVKLSPLTCRIMELPLL